MKLNQVICGDCIEEMKKLPENSIDTIITDPPYGLEFMGKEWDSFRATRKTKSQVHSLGTGMKAPTAKEMTNFQIWFQEVATEMLRVAKPGATLLCFGGTRTYHRLACAIEDAGWIIKDCIMWIYGSGFPKATDISKQLDKRAGKKGEEYIREDFAKRSNKTPQRKSQVICGQKGVYNLPATPEAKLWSGWKSHGLKPAYEPILVAMKPNEGSYAENALKYGVAGLNIDGGRIGMTEDEQKENYRQGNGKLRDGFIKTVAPEYRPTGRFPANCIFNEEAAKMLDEQSGELKSGARKNPIQSDGLFGRFGGTNEASKGGASRFFKVIKHG